MQQKVAIVCTSPGYGGLEMNTVFLARLLGKLGWQVCLLANEKSKMVQVCQQERLVVSTIQSLRAKTHHPFILRKWLASVKPDIILTPYNKDILPLSIYKIFCNPQSRIVYQQHMKVGVSKRDLWHTLIYRQLNLWISPLEYLKKETQSLTRFPSDRIRVIHLGIDSRKFNVPLRQEAARMELGLPKHAFIIGVLGRIDPKKGQDFLIRSMPSVLSRIHDAHLVIMGDVTPHEGNTFLHSLFALVKSLRLEQKVHFIKYKQEVVAFYKAIDVFAMSSHGETYGMVTLEAMAAGTPVVGVNRDGTRDILQQGRLGWLYELDDVAGYCDHLAAIADGKNVAEKTEAARNEVFQRYPMAGTIERIDSVLRELL